MANTSTTTKGKPQPDDKRPNDVLVYLARQGAAVAMWNEEPEGVEGQRVRIPAQRRHRIEPGLSFIPGALWGPVQAATSYRHGVESLVLEPLAGHGGDLAAEWARAPVQRIREALAKTSGVSVLARLQEMEERGPQRAKVLDAIRDRLDHLRVRVAEYERKRRDQRRRHRA